MANQKLYFHFFILSKSMMLSLYWSTFCRPNSLFALDSLQHHVHIRHTEGIWWKEGSCSGEASLPELPIKRERC